MTKRFLRGDAPAKAQQQRVKEPLVAGAVTFTIGNKTLEFDEWDADAIVADWSDSKWPEFRTITAAADGDDVLLTAKTAGVPFFVLVSVGGITQASGSSRNEVQTIALVNDPTGGTWNAAWGGDDVDIAWNASTATVQTALESLSTIEAGDVAVTGSTGGPWIITFGGRFAGQNVAKIAVDNANLTGGNAGSIIRTIQNYASGAGGSVDEDADGAGSLRIADHGGVYLQGGLTLAAGSAPDFTYTDNPIIRFPLHVPRGKNITAAELALPFGSFFSVSGDIDFTVNIEASNDAQYPTLPIDAHERPFAPPIVSATLPSTQLPGSTFTVAGLAPLIQAIVDRPGWVSGAHVELQLRVTAGAATGDDELTAFFGHSEYEWPILSVDFSGELREIQGIATSTAHSGTVTITLDGDSTAALDYDSTAADIQAELEALTSVGAGKVACTGGPWPAEIVCGFDITLGNLPQMTAVDTLNNGNVSCVTTTQGGPSVEVELIQRSRGPNHADDPLNYDDGAGGFGVPENLDQLICRDGKIDLLYGLRWRSPFTVSTGTDRLLLGAQQVAFWEDQAVEVINLGGGLPTGLAAATTYFIRDFDGVFCRLAATRGGPAINITTAGTGTHHVGVALASFETDSRYTGKLGLPRLNKEGGYPETRPRFLEAWIDEAEIAPGTGSGSARCHLDVSGQPIKYHQHKSAGGTDGAPAGQLICTGTGNELLVLGGELGVAIDADQAAAVAKLTVRGGNVILGPNVAVATSIERTGGSIAMNGCTINGSVQL